MNIFALDPSPQISASYHCDQHLHKMILESAQMLSTAGHHWFPNLRPYLYKPAYKFHPCTSWVNQSKHNMAWLVVLCQELESIRLSHNHPDHSSMEIIKMISDNVNPDSWEKHTPFPEAMPAIFKLRTSISTIEKYRLYYRWKHNQWVLDKGTGMSYKDRPVPDFMLDLLTI